MISRYYIPKVLYYDSFISGSRTFTKGKRSFPQQTPEPEQDIKVKVERLKNDPYKMDQYLEALKELNDSISLIPQKLSDLTEKDKEKLYKKLDAKDDEQLVERIRMINLLDDPEYSMGPPSRLIILIRSTSCSSSLASSFLYNFSLSFSVRSDSFCGINEMLSLSSLRASRYWSILYGSFLSLSTLTLISCSGSGVCWGKDRFPFVNVRLPDIKES
jgi:hypothetical protein